jgi:DNA polymerase III alpha subunit
LNKKSIEALAKVGALEGFGERNQIIASTENIIAHSKNFQSMQNSNQISLFGAADIALPEIPMVVTEPATKKQRLGWEKELLGLYISDHPVREYEEYFEKVATPIKQIDAQCVGKNISVGGVISNIHKIFLKNQKTMMFVTIEDRVSKIEILVFPKILEATGSIWEEDKIILASGKISDKDGSFKLLCDSVKVVNSDEVEQFRRILATQKNHAQPEKKTDPTKMVLKLPNNADQDILKKLSQLFDSCTPGSIKLYLSINNTRLETPYCIAPTDATKEAIQKIVPEARIEII